MTFVYSHPVEGALELKRVGTKLLLTCRWPFDRDTDDWIEIMNEFDVSVYLGMVEALTQDGTGEVRGVAGGYLRLRDKEGVITIDMANTGSGALAKSLSLRMAGVSADQLMKV